MKAKPQNVEMHMAEGGELSLNYLLKALVSNNFVVTFPTD